MSKSSNDKWRWMMQWCKDRGLHPGEADNWNAAARAWEGQKFLGQPENVVSASVDFMGSFGAFTSDYDRDSFDLDIPIQKVECNEAYTVLARISNTRPITISTT